MNGSWVTVSGNGVDIAAVYQLLSRVAETVSQHDQRLGQIVQTVTRHDQMLVSIVSELRDMRQMMAGMATKAELADIRQALTQYHSSVMGHGIMISELEDRVRRIEQHLSLT